MTSVLFEVVPRLTILLVAAGIVAAVELVVLALAGRSLRRQEPLRRRLLAGDAERGPVPRVPRAFELVAALAPLAVVGLMVAAIQTCRHMVLRGLGDPGQPDNAALMGRGISGEMHAVVIGLVLTLSVTALAGLAVALAVSARLRAQGLARALALPPGSPDAAAWAQYPGPAAGRLLAVIGGFLVLGLGPVLATALRAGTHRIATFAVVMIVSLVMLRSTLVGYLGGKGVPSRTEPLVGRQGIVTHPIDPVSGTGRVNVAGEDWAARSAAAIAVGTTIRVVGADGIVLEVTRA